VFSVGHFYISGFFTVGEKIFYFSLPDVRGFEFRFQDLMYRTAKHYKDYTGGGNQWVKIETGMAKNMQIL